jgi:hypothetical protein
MIFIVSERFVGSLCDTETQRLREQQRQRPFFADDNGLKRQRETENDKTKKNSFCFPPFSVSQAFLLPQQKGGFAVL